jgi:hypothetical protein
LRFYDTAGLGEVGEVNLDTMKNIRNGRVKEGYYVSRNILVNRVNILKEINPPIAMITTVKIILSCYIMNWIKPCRINLSISSYYVI